MGRKLDAVPDRVDLRDAVYQPTLLALPDRLINCDRVPRILDQGQEGACTGFAMAAVINYLLNQRLDQRWVSPRMLYEMARRYDEWPGEDYEGSSARGAMKGWVAHGVCVEELWPHERFGPENMTQAVEDNAMLTPGGAYYRVQHREIRDMHAALNEVGALYVTLMVHQGWDNPGFVAKNKRWVEDEAAWRELSYEHDGKFLRKRRFPVIMNRGRADGGHALAIVGYTDEGFIIQNSWGDSWGAGGYALLPYEDYILHATDVWVLQLGVPLKIDLWKTLVRVGAMPSAATVGLQRATPNIPLSDIRPYAIDIGNNGELSLSGEYWTTERDLVRMFEGADGQAPSVPRRARDWAKKRLLLYLHGGLNDEQTVAKRVVAFRDVFLDNQIYPMHIMWETGALETVEDIFHDLFTVVDNRAAGYREWVAKFREGLGEARDRSLELFAALPGTALWDEMKENARLASSHPDLRGGMQLLAQHIASGLNRLIAGERDEWEIHLAGHSAGSVFAAYALGPILKEKLPLASIQLLAPALRIDTFKKLMLPSIQNGACPLPTLYILDDVRERGDTVGPYGKSLLYLVSRAFERKIEKGESRDEMTDPKKQLGNEVPLLGMARFTLENAECSHDAEIVRLFQRKQGGLPSLVVTWARNTDGCRSHSNSHGGFDTDTATLNSVLYRILGQKPTREFTDRDLQFR